MISFILGIGVGTFLGIVIMAAMSAASWEDREREYRNMYMKGDLNQHEHKPD